MLRLAACLLAILILAAAPVAAAQPEGPGFDCRKARSDTEKLICAEPGLAALDRRLSDAFRELRQAGTEERKAELLKDQQRWLREVRDRCVREPGPGKAAAVACLSAGYRIRISEMAGPTASAEKPGGQPDGDPDPRRTLVRIQSALERAASGATAGDPGSDPLEEIVPAYAAFQAGDLAGMDERLEAIRGHAAGRVAALIEANAGDAQWAELVRAHFADLRAAAADAEPLTRLVAALRHVDGLLFVEAARPSETLAYPKDRSLSAGMAPSRLAGTWLKLPCRTLAGRAGQLAAVAARLGGSPAELLSCPAAADGFATLEALAGDPAGFPLAAPALPPPAKATPAKAVPPPPWDRETAVAHMADRPDLAGPVLEAASRQDALGSLDYALFLYAFRPDGAPRNATIAGLLNGILGQPSDEPERPQPIAGTDVLDAARLVEIVRYASESSIANSDSAFYAIPCAVLLARPELLEAIEPYYGSNRDNFLPRSGCGWGRGTVHDFPEQEVRAFVRASEAADGDFIANFGGSMKYGLMAGVEATLQAIAVDPRSFLQQPQPAVDHPYQTWGATGLTAHHVSLAIRAAYERALDRLVAFGLGRGMTEADAARAGKAALFAVAFGAECGGAMPGDSTRRLILAGASAGDVIRRLDLPDEGESPAVLACSATAGLEPLTHVAIVNPTLLEHLLLQGADVDDPNDFAKTPLMVAAQYDRLDAARLLLAHGAAVDAATRQGSDVFAATLYHDARTPLMYAAANASLPMIELLLRAGADPYLADSKGRRAVDYLLGFGPTQPNLKLTPVEQAEALRLLY